MQARKLPPGRGLSWIVEGVGLIRRAPMQILSATSTLAMIALLMALTPVFGQVVLPLLLPPLEIGMFLICRAASEGEFIHPALLFSGFRMNLRPLFAIGGIRLVVNMLALFVAIAISGVDMEKLRVIATSDQPVAENVLRGYLGMIGLFFLLRLPIEMAGWFAAPCIALRGVAVVKALFFSFIACWRNLGAMLIFAVALALICGFVPSFILSAIGLMPTAVALPLFAVGVVLGVSVFYAAFYRSACDVFGAWPHPWTHER